MITVIIKKNFPLPGFCTSAHLINSWATAPPVCAHYVPSFSGISLSSCYAWQVNLNRFSILRPPYITGSVLAHSCFSSCFSLSPSLSLFIPFPHFYSLVCSVYAFTCLYGVRRLSTRQIRLKANCPWDLIQTYVTQNFKKKCKKNLSATLLTLKSSALLFSMYTSCQHILKNQKSTI